MKLGFRKFSIHCSFPTTQCGHLSQTRELTELNDTLECRVLYVNDDKHSFVHLSLDMLSVPYDLYLYFRDQIKSFFGPNTELFMSSTHTHYGHDTGNIEYINYLKERVVNEIYKIVYVETKTIYYSVQSIPCKDVGKSRISGYESDLEILTLISFYLEDKSVFSNMIIYNVHPTILNANVPYFSSEFIGYALNKLAQKYSNQYFTYCTGASGDISSRFVRTGQDYDSVKELAEKFVSSVESLMERKENLKPLSLTCDTVSLPFEINTEPVNLDNLRDDLSEREYETIKFGQILRDKKLKLLNDKKSFVQISSINLGTYKLIFISHEIFSDYMNFIDLDKNMLVSYTNGYGPYILPKNFSYVTYEMLLDLTPDSFKEELGEYLTKISIK